MLSQATVDQIDAWITARDAWCDSSDEIADLVSSWDEGLALFDNAAAEAKTAGILLALVRKAWGDPGLCAILCGSKGWAVVGDRTALVLPGHYFKTELDALVDAILHAPEPTC